MIRSLIVLSLVLSGCASATLSPEGKRVRVVSTSPMNCRYVSEVSGSYKGASVSWGVVNDTAAAALVDIKNNAAAIGADTVELVYRDRGGHLDGEAYTCAK